MAYAGRTILHFFAVRGYVCLKKKFEILKINFFCFVCVNDYRDTASTRSLLSERSAPIDVNLKDAQVKHTLFLKINKLFCSID